MYRCNNCNYEQNKYFGLCPKCRQGTGEEVETPKNGHTGADGQVVSAWYDESFEWHGGDVLQNVKSVNRNEPKDEVVRKTGYSGLDAILSTGKGFVQSQVCLLGASPGVGKSTLCMSISDERTLYVSSEENYKQVNQRALRVKPESGAGILCTTSIAEVLEAIRQWDGDLVVVDSLQGLEFGVGYATTARFAHEITKAVKSTGKVGIIISQVTRGGEITGMNSIIHVVDTVLYLERSEMTGNIIAVSSKNRFGEVGGVAVFQHKQDGFVEVNAEEDKNSMPDVGSTYTETRFGHKLMTISVEALVVPSSTAYGLRKAVGYNTNRLMQLVGVLSFFGKLDLTRKDVYVAISSGLSTDDVGVELAVVNSMLSSIYGQVAVRVAYGAVKLNGGVSNGSVDGRPIKHILELIELYSERSV